LDSGETPIQPIQKGSQRKQGFAVFNDNFRDALKGPWYNTDPGYVQTGKNVEAVKIGICGSIDDFAANPIESINYVSCHDGRTLWDLLVASTSSNKMYTDTALKAMDKLAAFIIFTSHGVPSSSEEILLPNSLIQHYNHRLNQQNPLDYKQKPHIRYYQAIPFKKTRCPPNCQNPQCVFFKTLLISRPKASPILAPHMRQLAESLF
jgi:pullulanase